MKLTGNTILITGGGSGIGLGLAAALLARGNTVIITGRDLRKLEEAAKANPGLIVRQCDVSKSEQIAALTEWLKAEHPAFNILVNNAGVMFEWNVLDAAATSDARIDEEIAINFAAPLKLVRALLPQLLAGESAAIVNVSSGVAYAPLPISPVYSATKAALHSFTCALRLQLEGTKVAVHEVVPGLVNTPMSGKRYDNPEKFETPESFAATVLKALGKNVAEIRPGDSTPLFYLTRFAPDFASRIMKKKTRGERPT